MSELESPPQITSEEEGGRPVRPSTADEDVRPPQKKSRTGAFFFGALAGCLVLAIGLAVLIAVVAAIGSDTGELTLSTQKVAIVPIEGEIFDARETLELLHKYEENSMVKAIVIRINSPGGAIAPSQEIYSAIRRSRKPTVASMDSVAASGGLYIAVACDQIVANPGTITGSIGVVLQWFEMKELVKWAKMKPETITSGALKDAGSPYRELTEVERQYFQNIVTQLHSQFVKAVAEGRKGKLTVDEVSRIADGRVFTGEQAVALKMVDQLGTIDDAVRAAGKLAGIKGKPATIWPRRREVTLLEALTGANAKSAIEQIVSRKLPQFLYRW
ncbi:MAG TPA: signal peptide peptidase SppA [Thermoanaerobaculia bacterium]|nr:signal peptide peptidase SppA [Thermoanaerobaculia bacterium]